MTMIVLKQQNYNRQWLICIMLIIWNMFRKKNIWNTFWRPCPATLFIEADLFAEPIVRPSDTCSVNLEEQSSKKQVLMTWN
jgi:hypothetical protein